MQPIRKRFLSFALVVLLLLAAMANAAAPSVEELGENLELATEVVDFSRSSSTETPKEVQITVPRGSTLAVRLLCTSGFRGVLLSAHKGLFNPGSSQDQDLSSEHIQALIVGNNLLLPAGVRASQPVPYNVSKGLGIVGVPVSFVSVVQLNTPGDFTLIFSIMRVWMPASGTRHILKVHVTEEEAKGQSGATEAAP